MTAIPFETRMQALGLRLSAEETAVLAAQVAELDAAAAMLRAPRPYLEEPCIALRLSPAQSQAGGQ